MANNLLLDLTSKTLCSDLIARWVPDTDITSDHQLIKEIKRKSPVKFYSHKTIRLLELPKSDADVSRVSLMKSNLQKAVRQGLADCAVMSTLALIELDSIQLLRRLPIIALEDKYGDEGSFKVYKDIAEEVQADHTARKG